MFLLTEHLNSFITFTIPYWRLNKEHIKLCVLEEFDITCRKYINIRIQKHNAIMYSYD